MSSPPFDATIDLAPRPSLRALSLLFWIHTAVLVLALAALKPGLPMALLAAGVAVSWFWTRRHPAFGYGKRALTRLTWHAEGGWTLHDASGAQFDGELQGNSLAHDALLILNFRLKDGGRRSRALLGDEVDEELLRRLRARLRMARGRQL
jgi:toxin CptA